MSAGPTLPFATDRRELAAQMCHLLAHGFDDPSLSLDQLGRVAQEIATFMLEREEGAAGSSVLPTLRVIEGGKHAVE